VVNTRRYHDLNGCCWFQNAFLLGDVCVLVDTPRSRLHLHQDVLAPLMNMARTRLMGGRRQDRPRYWLTLRQRAMKYLLVSRDGGTAQVCVFVVRVCRVAVLCRVRCEGVPCRCVVCRPAQFFSGRYGLEKKVQWDSVGLRRVKCV
jgi:hypothetical protein